MSVFILDVLILNELTYKSLASCANLYAEAADQIWASTILKTLTGRKLDRRYGLPCDHSGRLLNGALTGVSAF
jgi:hypothetical protein